ncbi:hypothetical protein A2619_04440 [candidate division WWE3 bacterium RIFOXYD1_FULL_39_9]|uniref:VWFA domain-containing protein n=1 Tax=candidate division WWE3 bacterium RIFOXYD1_FULL_39_9 TaxID=1802649 RepID=A0A1F4X6A9_UNCKA|nr:MAG: hypothetical protein A2619_04440 [candidate division WWE3 bacterium RIFOXYD1_FULL_39_9]
MEKIAASQNQIVNQLLRVGHGNLSIYNDIGLKAVKHEPELFAHIIAWNELKGEVRDSKVAFPILSLRSSKDDELYENAAAHLCKLSPKDFLRACRYHRELPLCQEGGGTWLKQAVRMFIREREKSIGWWDRTVLQHRESMKSLYAIYHVKPNKRAQEILFEKKYPKNSVFQVVKDLKNMKAQEAAGAILNHKIPYLIAVGALGGIKGKSDVILALIERMTGAELITNTNMLQKMGVFENPALKAAYDNGIVRMQKDKKTPSMKITKAAEAVAKTDKKLSAKLHKAQEDKLDNSSIDGDWLVLGDRSGSMQTSIEVARNVAALIARQVKGNVHLVFFNDTPIYFDVTGKTLEQIKNDTKRLTATGSTSIGCGLELIKEKGIVVNGIAVCTDGGDNRSPYFHNAYDDYRRDIGIEPTVYMFHVPGENDRMSSYCESADIQLQKFELGNNVDYYSLPNLIKTMRTSKYSLVDEIMQIPLLTLKDVFKKEGR